jgi:(p)ppGpp synthase/HD superfamily hydrolase
MDKFLKLKMVSRYWLHGIAQTQPEYYSVIQAAELGAKYHVGSRKSGQPEFIHQLEIFSHLRTLHNHLQNPVLAYQAAFLHDVMEDYDVTYAEISRQFGTELADVVERLSKIVGGIRKDDAAYFSDVASCPIASVVKLADRVNNVGSMVGVFTHEKMQRYVDEVNTFFRPLIRTARRNFPEQEAVYENMKLTLMGQINLIEHLLQTDTPPNHSSTTIHTADSEEVQINITISVPKDWEQRLDMQYIVEREVKADRWSWDWKKHGN